MGGHSRRIVGWQLSARRTAAVTARALEIALRRRRPEQGLVFHSDRGVEYGAYVYRDLLGRHGITQSMNRPRHIGDNACMESFFHSLKSDCVHGERFDDDAALAQAIGGYIAHCNRRRLHSALGYRSPIDYEGATA
jgi:transposase InsO family protein